MTYKTGFIDLSDEELKKFLSELGMSKNELERGMAKPRQWAAGWPSFKKPVEHWIKQYRKYAKSLDPTEKAELHKDINRLFYSLKEGKFVSKEDLKKNRNRYRANYTIPDEMKHGNEAMVWLKLAGSYTHALLKKNDEKVKQQQLIKFHVQIPIAWLDKDKAGYFNSDESRAFSRFVDDLSENWAIFINSYLHEVHGTVINNSPVAASLQSFLKGQLPDGTPLRRPPTLIYWPKPLSHYAGQPTARQLFEARKNETEALKAILSGAKGDDRVILAFPRWLRFGVVGADLKTPPKVLSPEPKKPMKPPSMGRPKKP